MTDDFLSRLSRLRREATPGKCKVRGGDVAAEYVDDKGRKCFAIIAVCSCGGQPNETNAQLIAHLVNHAEEIETVVQDALAERADHNKQDGNPCECDLCTCAALDRLKGGS